MSTTESPDENIVEESSDITSSVLDDILGKTKTAAVTAIRGIAKSTVIPFLNTTKQFTPVYKIMITVPLKGSGKPYRYILADTSRPSLNFLSDHNSPVVGMWIDQSDMTEPDKAIVLIENPVTIISEIFEQDMLQFHQFGVRNWIDIWVGYVPATLTNIVTLGSVVGGIFPGEMLTAPFTSPDPFLFGNDSHVFSGPIVSIKRTVDSTGDRLQIIGFSPVMVLKQTESEDFLLKRSTTNPITIDRCINEVAKAVFPIDIDELGMEYNKIRFPMGKFPFTMFAGEGDKFRIVPVNEGAEVPPGNALPIWTKQFADHDLVGIKLREKTLQITLKGTTSLYDLLFADLTTAAYTELGRLYASIHRAKGNNPEWAFKEGEGHPGVFVKYGFAHEISGIRKMVEEKKAYSPSHIQSLTLGRDCREFEGGVEYGSVFNIRKFMCKTDDTGKNALFMIPNDFMGGNNMPSLDEEPYEAYSDLWDKLKDDIEIYGPSISPLEKWIWGKDGGAVQLSTKGVAEYIARSMRDTYFTGMSGSVFAVGNSALKPGRVLSLVDGRGKLSQYSATELAKKGISSLGKSFKKFRGTEEPATPKMFRLKNIDKNFYIWKVRHYLGVGSGYVTKVYYAEERNRSWQNYTESIDNIIRKALMQSKMTMAGAGRI